MHCPTNASKMIHCKYCPKKLMTDSAMAMHVKSHLNKIHVFECVLCSQRFTLSIDLTEHVQEHLVDGFYKCPKCGRVSLIHINLKAEINKLFSTFRILRNIKNMLIFANTFAQSTPTSRILAQSVEVPSNHRTNFGCINSLTRMSKRSSVPSVAVSSSARTSCRDISLTSIASGKKRLSINRQHQMYSQWRMFVRK